ncbi:SRPBCC family protein [Methylorubrum extorquens]|uniref:SRPBCC family protein n=1 Tax=Methylorubrum extorquens TaxID=408 RepID=A0AAX3WCJ0_METEX|nr:MULTISPECIES: SRPBCC family protein [Methylobacteriaceae]KQO94227.1 polyketide cyclase [Methylobacterium sp. Leaf92]KQQ17726.1 polyketide cyclase [Methylobacterium sp. Leaf122]WHQ69159.1 SRPBCC family protein [Methylorubrum extorquens]
MSDADDPRDLVLTRLIPAPRRALWRAWTEPELVKRWFAPKPYTTPVVELDLRPGGSNLIVMRSPDGQDLPNRGVYLEVVPDTRLVVTDAYRSAWVPSEKPFLTVILTFADEAGGTRYTARVRHWTLEDRQAHEAMGFEQGWGICADQLTELVRDL